MTKPLPDQVRQRVLDLRAAHSLREVAAMTALPLGTVKTICARSGVFRDNPTHRALFTLPPIKESTNTGVSVPELPPQQTVTGDKEVDAVLWLRAVIKTGQAPLIEKAMQAAARIKTPLSDLEKRYAKLLLAQNHDSFSAVFASIGFADLEGLADYSVATLARQHEARSRFGDDLYNDTPAELFCIAALEGLECYNGWKLADTEVDGRFSERPELLPHTLRDCLHELVYWDALYFLRHAVDGYGDHRIEVQARDDFVFRRLASIRARTKDEAIEVFRYLSDSDKMDREETNAILANLIG